MKTPRLSVWDKFRIRYAQCRAQARLYKKWNEIHTAVAVHCASRPL